MQVKVLLQPDAQQIHQIRTQKGVIVVKQITVEVVKEVVNFF
jgi:hypothetical protein